MLKKQLSLCFVDCRYTSDLRIINFIFNSLKWILDKINEIISKD